MTDLYQFVEYKTFLYFILTAVNRFIVIVDNVW